MDAIQFTGLRAHAPFSDVDTTSDDHEPESELDLAAADAPLDDLMPIIQARVLEDSPLISLVLSDNLLIGNRLHLLCRGEPGPLGEHIETIDLSNTGIGDNAWLPLGLLLNSYHTLVTLDLCDNQLTDTMAFYLSHAAFARKIANDDVPPITVRLQGNHLTDHGIAQMHEAVNAGILVHDL